METVSVLIRKDVFERLQALSTPLIDDVNSVLVRLIEPWEKNGGKGRVISIPPIQVPTEWRSSRGERFPIGLPLTGNYRGKSIEAKVTAAGIEFNGHTYDNPSTAAAAAKIWAGCTPEAASENGWKFWHMPVPGVPNKICSINRLRKPD